MANLILDGENLEETRDITCAHPNPMRKRSIIDDQIVLMCRKCRMVTVDGSNHWIAGDHPKVIDELNLLILIRDQEQATQKAIMESSIDDPRWTNLSANA